jgi:dUTP pyrophosphatase
VVEPSVPGGDIQVPETPPPSNVPRMLHVPMHRLDPEIPAPAYAHEGDAGADLYAREGVKIAPRGGRALVPTGVKVAIPPGCAGFVLPRSGLALRHGVTCLNTPGLIDSGYRGELAVILVNTDPEDHYEVKRGDRIAQLVVQPVDTVCFQEVSESELPPAERGTGGFGHTGR